MMAYKQIVIVRKDLKMGVGKTAAQVAHASVGALNKASKSAVATWEDEGGKKVVLKVPGLKELSELRRKAAAKKLPVFVVRDAGLTQLDEGTVTCVGIGPADEEKVDEIARGLKLL